MSLNSWGMYPQVENNVLRFSDEKVLENIVKKSDNLIAYGNGRSYGDSALAKIL
jgi:hypothetical protein